MNNQFFVLLAMQALLHALKVPSNVASELVPVVEEVEQLSQHDFQGAAAFKHNGEENIILCCKAGASEDEFLANAKAVYQAGVIGPL